MSATYTSPITIPAGTIVSTQNNVLFVTRQDYIIQTGASHIDMLVYEGTLHTEGPFTATGDDEQNYTLSFHDVAENFLDVYVNGVLWTDEQDVFPSRRTSRRSIRRQKTLTG